MLEVTRSNSNPYELKVAEVLLLTTRETSKAHYIQGAKLHYDGLKLKH